MAVKDSPISVYDWTIGLKRVITDEISLIDPTDTRFLDRLGMSGANSWSGLQEFSYKIEWQEDSMLAMSSNMGASLAGATTDVTFDVVDGSIFKAGMIVLLESEYVYVSSVSTNTLTVIRAWSGSIATHESTVEAYVKGMARLDGSEATYDAFTEPTQPYNYTSIVELGMKVTGTEAKQARMSTQKFSDYQGDKNMKKFAQLLTHNLFHGARAAGAKGTGAHSAGGLKTYITTDGNYTAQGGVITKAAFDAQMEACMLDGGKPTLIVCHPSIYSDISKLMGDYIYPVDSGGRVGLPPATGLHTDFGDLDILWDRWCPTADLFGLDMEHIGMYTFRGIEQTNLAPGGDYFPSEMLGEFSLAVRHGDTAHFRIGTITT